MYYTISLHKVDRNLPHKAGEEIFRNYYDGDVDIQGEYTVKIMAQAMTLAIVQSKRLKHAVAVVRDIHNKVIHTNIC